MKSVYDAIKSIVSLVPAVRTANANGTGVDTKGFNSAKLVISAGDIDTVSTDETYSYKIQDSADNVTFADVSGATGTITADNQVTQIRLEGLGTNVNRYVRAVLTVGGTTPSIDASAVFELGNAFKKPVN